MWRGRRDAPSAKSLVAGRRRSCSSGWRLLAVALVASIWATVRRLQRGSAALASGRRRGRCWGSSLIAAGRGSTAPADDHGWTLGLIGLDWWFAFGVVAFSDDRRRTSACGGAPRTIGGMTAAEGMAQEERRRADDRQARLRSLAAVDEVLREPAVEELLARYPRALVVDAVRAVIDRLRAEILAGEAAGDAAGRQGGGPHAGRPRALGGAPARRGGHAVAAARDQRDRRRGAHQPRPRAAAAGGRRGRRHGRRPATPTSSTAWRAASAPRARTTCTTCSAPSPAPRTRWSSTTTPPRCCSRWRPRRAAARCSSPAASSSRSATASASPTSCARAAPSWSRSGTTNRTYLRDFEAAWTRAHARRPARAHEQLPHRRLHRRAGAGGAGDARRTSAAPCSSTTSAAAPWRGLELFAEEPALAGERRRRAPTSSPSAATSCSAARRPASSWAGPRPSRRCAATRWRAPCASTSSTWPRSTRVLRLYLDPQRARGPRTHAGRARAAPVDEVRDRAGRLRGLLGGAGVRRGAARARRDGRARRRRRAAGHRGAQRRRGRRGARGRAPTRVAGALRARRAGRRLPRARGPPALRPARRARRTSSRSCAVAAVVVMGLGPMRRRSSDGEPRSRAASRRAAAHARHRRSHRPRQDGAGHAPHRQEHRPPARGAGARHLHRARLRRAGAAGRRPAERRRRARATSASCAPWWPGATGIDLFLLVIAADDGVMPQTRGAPRHHRAARRARTAWSRSPRPTWSTTSCSSWPRRTCASSSRRRRSPAARWSR